ncbi:MAG: family 43 glycosylhydrolase [Marinilabiliaceae bacterium]
MRTTISFFMMLIVTATVYSQNPLIMDQFTADPSARVFNGKVYVYPSHDIRKDSDRFADWFCMEDYHVFSSENLTEWKDHGVILSQYDVPWVDTTSYSMWAPDCIEKDGKYYFYFPAIRDNGSEEEERTVGVAVAPSPTGPFEPEPEPIEGVSGIDPNPFIDDDGQAYLYWGGGEKLYVAKLKENMLELATEPQVVEDLPPKFKEGPYVFKRQGKYYFTFPHVPDSTERLVYAMGDDPMGPFEYKGTIMEESPIGCWTNHHSIIEYKDQWYLFYHHNDLSPDFDKNRSIKADSLLFNADGTIQKITPSWRGVGITPANTKIQVDRYSDIPEKGTTTEFIDPDDTFKGWEISLKQPGSWVRYDKVDFKEQSISKVKAKTIAGANASFEIRLNSVDGEILATIDATESNDWTMSEAALDKVPDGVHDLFVVSKGNEPVSIDWVRFE